MDAYLIKPLLSQLSSARKAKKLSQAAVSQVLGCPQSYLSAVEHGKHDIRLTTFLELARLLDLEVALVPRALAPQLRQLLADFNGEVVTVDDDRAFVPMGDEDAED